MNSKGIQEFIISDDFRASVREMENGETRYSLVSTCDRSGYTRTVSGPRGGWQDSHFHRFLSESYIVQSGAIALAQLCDECLRIRVMTEGQIVTIPPSVPHNVYLFPNTVIHTVKQGVSDDDDWVSEVALDQQTKGMTEPEIRSWASASSSNEKPRD